MRTLLAMSALGLVVAGAWMLVTPYTAVAVAPTWDDGDIDWTTMQSIEIASDDAVQPEVLAKPSGSACCNPDLEPGGGIVPICFEGHTCCSDGNWRCNNPDGSPSCSAGEVCAEGCAERNQSCSDDAECCSGNCKRNGRCG